MKNQPNLHWRILAKHLAVVARFLPLLFTSSSPHIAVPARHLHLLSPCERPVPLISCLPREAEGTLGPISPTGYPHTVKLSGGPSRLSASLQAKDNAHFKGSPLIMQCRLLIIYRPPSFH